MKNQIIFKKIKKHLSL